MPSVDTDPLPRTEKPIHIVPTKTCEAPGRASSRGVLLAKLAMSKVVKYSADAVPQALINFRTDRIEGNMGAQGVVASLCESD